MHDGALALAELSYQAGLLARSKSPKSPVGLVSRRGGAGHACTRGTGRLAARPGRPDPQRGGVAADPGLPGRGQAARPQLAQRSWRSKESRSPRLRLILNPLQIANLRVAADLRVKGMDHIYQRTGLGVPLVAHRVVPLDANTPDVQDVQDEFLPRDLRTGATAVMKPGGGLLGGEWREGSGDAHPARLVRTEVSAD